MGFVDHPNIYMLAHSVGRPPINARDQAQQFFDLWEQETDSWSGWLAGIKQFQAALADLLNAESSEFCPQANLSSALTKVLYSLPVNAGKTTLLLSEHDFPSMGFVMDRAQRQGFKLKFIPRDANHLDPAVWDEFLTEDVCCALITHVHSNTGCQIPVAEITQLTRRKGIVSIVDICQTAGIVEVKLKAWQADVVLGSCVKWLCGGPGAGFLWVAPNFIDQCEPLDVGWFSHINPMEFDIHHFTYAQDTSRFWGGTPSILPYMVAANSIRHIDAIGVNSIRQHNLTLTQRLMDNLPARYLQTPRSPQQRGGTLVLHCDEKHPQVVNNLQAAGIIFDERANGVRISPHIYNTEAEIDSVLACFS